MTTATLDRRSIRAAGIVERNEVLEVRPGIFEVCDTVSGSGQRHLVSGQTCGCADARRGNRCKHLIAKTELLKQRGDVCSSCGAPTESIQSYIGGRGYCGFIVCSADRFHPVRRVS